MTLTCVVPGMNDTCAEVSAGITAVLVPRHRLNPCLCRGGAPCRMVPVVRP